jgi:hypothetical protein
MDRDTEHVTDEISDTAQDRTSRQAEELERRAEEIGALRGSWADLGGGTAVLMDERRRERAMEERKARRWSDRG